MAEQLRSANAISAEALLVLGNRNFGKFSLGRWFNAASPNSIVGSLV